MSRKIKFLIICYFLTSLALGIYFDKNKITPEPEPDGYSYYQKGDYTEAFDYFTLHAENDSQAAFSLAMMYWNGIGVDKNTLISQEWLIKSANSGNKNSLYNLGFLRNKGLIQSPDNDTQGLTSLTKAADLGSVTAKKFLNDLDIKSTHYRYEKLTLLPIYGEQSFFEKETTLNALEKLAKEGNKESAYQYLNNPDSMKKSKKTELLIAPFIQNKDPKMMYLKYRLINNDINLLFDSANLNYPDAIYHLHQIYNGDIENNHIEKDYLLSRIYLNLSANLEHHDGLIKKIEQLTNNNDDDLSLAYHKGSIEKLIDTLLSKYPNSPQAMLTVANIYLKKNSDFYDTEKAFNLASKSYKIHPSPESKLLLAKLHSNDEYNHMDIKKSVYLLKENISNNDLMNESQTELVKLYFDFDTSDYLKKEEIINILRESVTKNKDGAFNQNYILAHFYADLLLEEDAINNDEYAFLLYNKSHGYARESDFHKAIAIAKYKKITNDRIINSIVYGLEDDLKKRILTQKKRQEGYDILFKYGMESQRAIDFIVEQSLDNNKIKAEIQPLLSQHTKLAFQYTIKNIINESSSDNINKNNLKKYYKDILKLSELGSVDAMKFIITKKYTDSNGYNTYQDGYFDELTNITTEDRLFLRKKCANLGDLICLKDLSVIYKEGKEGVKKDIIKASEYEKLIGNNSYNSVIKSELISYETDREKKSKRDKELSYLMNMEDGNEKQLKLAKFYQRNDNIKSLNHAKDAYRLGNKEAGWLLYSHYIENICEDKDNINKAAHYLKEWLTTSEQKTDEYKYNIIRIIADYYLTPPCLVEQDIDKAIEWYLLSLDYPYKTNNIIDTVLNEMYTSAYNDLGQDAMANMYISALKSHNDYIIDMNVRLGEMNFARPSFSKIYEAYLLKGDVKEAYYYGLLLNHDVNNVGMFYSLSEIERKNIEDRATEYLKKIKR